MRLESAIQWEKCQALTVEQFLTALQQWGGIGWQDALRQLHALVTFGLPLHAKALYPDTKVDQGAVIQSIYGAILGKSVYAEESTIKLEAPDEIREIAKNIDEIPRPEGMRKILNTSPALGDLIVFRDQAFKIFARLAVSEPYPWLYPDALIEEVSIAMGDEQNDVEQDAAELFKSNPAKAGVHKNAVRFSGPREEVLSAGLALLSRFPDQCRGKDGRVIATKLATLIDQKYRTFWPESECPPLELRTIEDLLRSALRKTTD